MGEKEKKMNEEKEKEILVCLSFLFLVRFFNNITF